MKAGIDLLAALLLLLAPGCQRTYNWEDTQEIPAVPENGYVVLDLSRWRSVSAKDSTEVARLWDALHVSSTLQGIVNRDAPRLFVNYVSAEGRDVDMYWLDKSREAGKWLDGREYVTIYDPVKAVEMFRDEIDGLVVYDSNLASTSNVASTVAGADNLVAVRFDLTPGSMYTRLVKHGFETKVWLVNEDGSSRFKTKLEPYQWAVDNYLKSGRCSGATAAYYIDQYWRKCPGNATMNHHQLTNHDYFVSRRAFFFDLSPWSDEVATDAPGSPAGADLEMLKTILMEIYRLNGGSRFCHIGGFPAWAYKYTNHGNVGGKHTPVEAEWKFAEIIGEYNAFKDADAIGYGAMANASFWHHYPLKDKYPQKWVTRDELKRKGYLTAEGKVDLSRRYMIFYVGDYDASPWIYQMMPTLWNDPARGKVPLMWSISPVLCERAPMVMDYLRETATEADYFAAGDNGAGYLNPGSLEEPRRLSGLPSALDAWAEHSKPYFDRWGLSITGFIIDGNNKGMSEAGFKCYAKFSPNGIVPQRAPKIAQLVDGMPVMRSAGGPGDTVADAIVNVSYDVTHSHQNFPFYWYRTVLKSPSWHASVRDGLAEVCPQAVWMSAPEYFELLKCYLEEGHEL